MKKIIIYATKTGTTKKCAFLLKEKLEEVTLIDINEIKTINLNDYEQIIIGSYIRVGMIDKKIKKFILENKEVLKTKSCALFLCCGFDENIKQYLKDNIPNDLLESLIACDTFGGELDHSKQKGFDKLIIKMVSKANPNREIKILNENIIKFVNRLKKV